jgi:hypothetical protein
MPGDPFRKVLRGQPLAIPAPAWNTLMDVARAYKKREGQKAGGAVESFRTDVIKVKNSSGADVIRFGVLGLDAPVFPTMTDAEQLREFHRHRVFNAVTPASPTHNRRFCVLAEPLANGAIGRALVCGAYVAKLSIVDAAQQLATVKNADATQLETTWGEGVPILWKESGTGTKWALVLLGTFDVGTGQYMGMNLTTTAQNVRGWDFLRAAALPGV